jgi:2-polyprenyl-6-methoxyphenol hydroxylase-like FAD-dependent oxidoreductase
VLSPSRVFAELGTTHVPDDPRRVMGRAVVLGGSMAGLLAARVLSDHADQVVVIERDDFGTTAGFEPRPGVPQGRHVHALLPSGQLQLERWFPDFADEAVAAGAVVPDPAAVRHYVNGTLRRYANDLAIRGKALSTTRPLLEGLVRARVARIPNVQIVHGRAAGLVMTGDRVTGVRYHPDAAPDPDPGPAAGPAPGPAPAGETRTESADLVVDAMGRSSRLGDWLTEHGRPSPPMRRMPIKLTYATALFRRDPQISDIDVVFSQALPAPGRVARIGGINAVEGDRWIMLVAGYDDDRPSRDPADFAARCRCDFPAVFGDIAEHGERLSDVMTYHQADSRRRDFHALERLPAGLVAVGDAVASFNPVYGQGMASGALHASALSAYLRGDPRLDEPATAYYTAVRVVVDAAWQISTTADLALPHVDGPYPRGYRLLAATANLIFAMSATDRELNQRLSMVTTMLAHPNSLAQPGVLLRAALARLRRRDPATS